MKVQTDNPAYERDTRSRALLLNDKGKADDYLTRKRMMDRNRIQEEELNNLKSELDELRKIVGSLVNAAS